MATKTRRERAATGEGGGDPVAQDSTSSIGEE
jgi:hypothetical protein